MERHIYARQQEKHEAEANNYAAADGLATVSRVWMSYLGGDAGALRCTWEIQLRQGTTRYKQQMTR